MQKKETTKITAAAYGWLSSNAQYRLCFPARSQPAANNYDRPRHIVRTIRYHGLFLNLWALTKRADGGLEVILLAGIGLMFSGGTLLLIGGLIVSSLFH